ncbi:Adp-dependent glucokinase-like, partial [Globisporangium splendens]
MYSVSQLFALSASLAVCIVAVLYSDFFASLLPTKPEMLSALEQQQLIASLVFETTKTAPRSSISAEDTAAGDEAPRKPRLAFCCSADLDVSVRAVELMSRVQQVEKEQFDAHAHRHSKKTKKRDVYDRVLHKEHHERIGSLRDLQESFAFYFSNGAAAEQSMSSPEQFREVVKFANEIDGVKHKVGGNAATMADRAALEGCDVLLGAGIGKEMRKHFNSNIQLVGHLEDHEHEDVHLVLEYAKGDEFRGHVTPRANRYYLNHDIYNARLSVLEEFEQALDAFHPDLVVIGGLQLMEVETDEERRLTRLTKLSEVLQNLFLKQVPSHYEFAAVSDFTLFDDTVRLVLPWVDSIGLNEQELYILHHYLVTGEEGMATNSRPTVAQISEQLHDVIQFAARAQRAFQHNGNDSGGKKATAEQLALAQLSRIHFHTLQFHIICQKQDTMWEDPTAALIQSALMSSKLACGKNTSNPQTMRPAAEMEVDPERVELLLGRQILVSKQQSLKVGIDPFSPVITWHEADFQCHLVPMLACKKPDHTAGLGDNISGTGMAYHSLQKNKP